MDTWFLIPALALLAGALALVPLGHQVLRRGVVFIDLAVAQAAAAGALWSMALLHFRDADEFAVLDPAGMAGAVMCAGAVAVVSRRWPQRREALIGLLYVVFACLALLGARLDAHGRDRMLELLAADVLWAQPSQVVVLAAAALLLWGLHRWRPALLAQDGPFYLAFAVVVSLAVPVLGLFVVFALLIGPALWSAEAATLSSSDGAATPSGAPTDQPFATPRLWLSALLGSASGMVGLALSWWWDAPSGPCVALACALLGLAALLRRR